MNLKQQETKELQCDETDRSEKPMEYEKFLEILDQSANNITPRHEPLHLLTPFSQREKTNNLKNVTQIFLDGKSSTSNLPSTIKGDSSI